MARYWTTVPSDYPNWLQMIATGDNPWARAGDHGGCAHVSATLDPECWVGLDAEIGRGARIGFDAVVGSRTLVRDMAIIGATAVVGPDSDIGVNTLIGDGTRIGEGALIGRDVEVGVNVAIGDGVTIEQDAYLRDGSRVPADTHVG